MKIDQIIAYKRRLEWQKSQRKAMDKHLVHLVRQTEVYTGDISRHLNKNVAVGPLGCSEGDITSSLQEKRDCHGSEPNRRGFHNATLNLGTRKEGDASSTCLEATNNWRTEESGIFRPFILDSAIKLRPYQQTGLNWLVSMHERRLNGILADEMGLGKTLQTIALLAHLATHRGLWGPHLVVVPTSCLVNWEFELKRFCPSLKIVTYYGAAKARKQLRTGWSRASAVHVVVTSYQLAVQDASIFRRKKFYYLILDEAHNIKNFDSRRWRTLLAFQAQRRLLLTGTPLQNSLMELWSLMHFLMPHLFRSQHEFSYWFANPLQYAVEGKSRVSADLVKRLHAVMRPFVLRRLKKDVAKQLPGKYEHEVCCRLSRRQQLLYEEFMTRNSTRCAMTNKRGGGNNLVSMMNIVMQLRKVCNHPDLFEPRSVLAPLVLPRLILAVPRVITEPLFSTTTMACNLFCPCMLHLDPYLCSSIWALLAPTCLVLDKAPITLNDASLGAAAAVPLDESNREIRLGAQHASVAILLRHVRSSKSALNALMSTNQSSYASDFISRAFRSSAPLVTAWRAIPARPCGALNNQVEANRQRYVASDALRQLLESNATFAARYAASIGSIRRFAFVVPAVLSYSPVLIKVRSGSGKSETGSMSSCSCLRHSQPDIDVTRAALTLLGHATLALCVSFPDRSLVQWDSGKFHKLAPLLRQLKQHAHRCLIFTQMSRMLDVLETFLCWHGHSYLRLDGGTPPGDRQRLMDRFNSDTSIFCFVLSTRSGGLGVNLTGADTVIFYDSDWNPAMDAQAMDRAHRIGQTRDVHIYRLVCGSTIEENILIKARQKQRLELVTITEGKFNSGQLRETHTPSNNRTRTLPMMQARVDLGERDIAAAMAQLEDAVDVRDAHAAAAEAASQAQEFDDTLASRQQDGCDGSGVCFPKSKEAREANEDESLEAEFSAWQQQIGPDPDTLTKSLNAVERRALRERENHFFANTQGESTSAKFLAPAERRLMEMIKKENSTDEAVLDVDTLELLKEKEELRACSEGDLLATDLYFESDIPESRGSEGEFLKRRRLAKLAKRERRWTGAAWELRIDAKTSDPFWYNIDTAEATWLKPLVIQRRDSYLQASLGGFANMPREVSLLVITMCEPIPTRHACALVCRNWAMACSEDHLLVKVLPIECLGEASCEGYHQGLAQCKFSPTFRNAPSSRTKSCAFFASLNCAVNAARPGETIILGAGNYWENEIDLRVTAEVRIIGDAIMPERVIIELAGAIQWSASNGALVGVMLRRPGVSMKATSALVLKSGRLACHRIIIDNAGGGGAAITIHHGT